MVRGAAERWAVESGLRQPLKVGTPHRTATGWVVEAEEWQPPRRRAVMTFAQDGTQMMYELDGGGRA